MIDLQLDDWVLCRLYHKKNEYEKMQGHKEKVVEAEASLTDTRTPESEIDDDAFPAFDDMAPAPAPTTAPAPAGAVQPKEEVQDFGSLGGDDWLAGINLDDLQMDADFNMLVSPVAPKADQDGGFPFF